MPPYMSNKLVHMVVSAKQTASPWRCGGQREAAESHGDGGRPRSPSFTPGEPRQKSAGGSGSPLSSPHHRPPPRSSGSPPVPPLLPAPSPSGHLTRAFQRVLGTVALFFSSSSPPPPHPYLQPRPLSSPASHPLLTTRTHTHTHTQNPQTPSNTNKRKHAESSPPPPPGSRSPSRTTESREDAAGAGGSACAQPGAAPRRSSPPAAGPGRAEPYRRRTHHQGLHFVRLPGAAPPAPR